MMKGKNNTLLAPGAGANITTASNCFCWGIDAGLDITTEDNQVRIGNGANRNGKGMVILGKNVVITQEVFELLGEQDLLEKIEGIAHE